MRERVRELGRKGQSSITISEELKTRLDCYVKAGIWKSIPQGIEEMLDGIEGRENK